MSPSEPSFPSAHAHPGILSLKAFILGLGLTACHSLWGTSLTLFLLLAGLYLVGGCVALKALEAREGTLYIGTRGNIRSFYVQVAGFFLGWGFSFGVQCVLTGLSVPLGWYLCVLAGFHYSEFLVTSYTSPETLNMDSFLLNHSKEYGVAAFSSLVEFFVELYFVPVLKESRTVSITGLVVCCVGEFLRKWAMFTASRNFTHLVRDTKAEGQYLVKSGPYALCRHPGYAGWFLWSIGTQVILVNPFCTIAYAVATYKFFKGRIYYEEACLLSFFGLEYIEYQENVPRTGVPFVCGYDMYVRDGGGGGEELEEEEDSSPSTTDSDKEVEEADED